MKHFQVNRFNQNQPCLLLLDGYQSHTRCLEALQFAKENKITMLAFPPHCSHWLQPLDWVFFKSLKAYFREEVRTKLKGSTKLTLGQSDFGPIFKVAYYKAVNLRACEEGFKSTGIWPINFDAIPKEAFKPSSVTERVIAIDNTLNNEARRNNLCLKVEEDTNALTTMSPVCIDQDSFSLNVEEDINEVITLSPVCENPFAKLAPLPTKTRSLKRKTGETSKILTSELNIETLKADKAKDTIHSNKWKPSISNKSLRNSNSISSNSQLGSSGLGAIKFNKIVERLADGDQRCATCFGWWTDDVHRQHWICCQRCAKWYHVSCQGYEGKGPTMFECIECVDDFD